MMLLTLNISNLLRSRYSQSNIK